MEIIAVPVLTDNYVWLIHNDDTGETAAVDPSVSDPVLDAAAVRGWSITQVLNTHWHPDHTGGNEGIKAATGCTRTVLRTEAGWSAGTSRPAASRGVK